MSKEYKAVLLDLDGTLVNTLYSLQDTMNKTMEHFGLDPISIEQVKKYIGNGYHVFVEKSIAATADRYYREAEKWETRDEDKAMDLDQKADEIMEFYDDACDFYIHLFATNCTYGNEAYPGMKESLEILKQRGMKLACVTNKSLEEADKVLDQVFGAGYFDYVSGDDGTHPLKPDTGVINDVCAKLQIPVSECIFVGDTRTDMETAVKAGMPSVGCAFGYRGAKELEKYHATTIIDHAGELVKAIDSISR